MLLRKLREISEARLLFKHFNIRKLYIFFKFERSQGKERALTGFAAVIARFRSNSRVTGRWPTSCTVLCFHFYTLETTKKNLVADFPGPNWFRGQDPFYDPASTSFL